MVDTCHEVVIQYLRGCLAVTRGRRRSLGSQEMWDAGVSASPHHIDMSVPYGTKIT